MCTVYISPICLGCGMRRLLSDRFIVSACSTTSPQTEPIRLRSGVAPLINFRTKLHRPNQGYSAKGPISLGHRGHSCPLHQASVPGLSRAGDTGGLRPPSPGSKKQKNN